VLVGLLFFVSGLMIFGPRAERERDHRPPGTASEAHDSRWAWLVALRVLVRESRWNRGRSSYPGSFLPDAWSPRR